MSLNWDDIENGVQAAVVAASGFASDHVIWKYQNKNAPTQDYVALTMGGEISLGIDRMRMSVDLARPQGQEILMEAKGDREIALGVEVFTNASLGESAARRVASRISAALMGLPSVRYLMTRVGITPFDPQPVQWIPDIPNTSFRGRASIDIRCYVPLLGVYEFTTYIARVTGTMTILQPGATSISVPFDSALAPQTIVALAITPTGFGLGVGLTQQMTARATFSDGTTGDLTASVAWGSSAPGAATIDTTGATIGLVHGIAAGTSTLTASIQGVSSSTLVTVA